MKDRYLDDDFGLGVRGTIIVRQLENYSDKIVSISEKYDVSQYFLYRTISYLHLRRLKVNSEKKRGLEKSIEITERWLRWNRR